METFFHFTFKFIQFRAICQYSNSLLKSLKYPWDHIHSHWNDSRISILQLSCNRQWIFLELHLWILKSRLDSFSKIQCSFILLILSVHRLLLVVPSNDHARYFACFCITSGTYTTLGLIIAWCQCTNNVRIAYDLILV